MRTQVATTVPSTLSSPLSRVPSTSTAMNVVELWPELTLCAPYHRGRSPTAQLSAPLASLELMRDLIEATHSLRCSPRIQLITSVTILRTGNDHFRASLMRWSNRRHGTTRTLGSRRCGCHQRSHLSQSTIAVVRSTTLSRMKKMCTLAL